MHNFYNHLARFIVSLVNKFNIKKNFTNKLKFNVGLNSLLHNKGFYEKAKKLISSKHLE